MSYFILVFPLELKFLKELAESFISLLQLLNSYSLILTCRTTPFFCFSRATDHLLYIKSNGWFSVHLFLNVLLAFNFTGQFCPFETFLLHGFCLFFFRLFSLLCLPFTLPTPWVLLSFQLMFYNYKSLRGEGCIMISPRIFKFCIGGFNQQWMEMSM